MLGRVPQTPDPRVAPTYLALHLRACSDQLALRGHKKDEMRMRQSMEGRVGARALWDLGPGRSDEGPAPKGWEWNLASFADAGSVWT